MCVSSRQSSDSSRTWYGRGHGPSSGPHREPGISSEYAQLLLCDGVRERSIVLEMDWREQRDDLLYKQEQGQ